MSSNSAPAGERSCPLHLLPDSWKEDFLTKYSDGSMRNTLYMTCTGCRDWMLVSAQQATVTRTLPDRIENVFTAMHKDRQRLSIRGGQATGFVFRQKEDRPSIALTALGMLAGPHRAVTSLQLDLANVTGSMLRTAAATFPNLQKLHLGGDTAKAPRTRSTLITPEPMPNITELVIGPVAHSRADAVHWGVARCLPQLVSLRILDDHYHFDHAVAMKNLQRLHLQSDLTPQLADLLRQHAPALKHLAVTNVEQFPRHAPDSPPAPCPWETLELTQCTTIFYDRLRYLPPCARGALTVQQPGPDNTLELDAPLQGEVQDMTALLDRVKLPSLHKVVVQHPGEEWFEGWEYPPVPLLATALAALQAKDRELVLYKWPLTESLVPQLYTLMESWPVLSLLMLETHDDDDWPALPLPPLKVLYCDSTLTELQWFDTRASKVRELHVRHLSPLPVRDSRRISPWSKVQARGTSLEALATFPVRSAEGPVQVTVTEQLICNMEDASDIWARPSPRLPEVHLGPNTVVVIRQRNESRMDDNSSMEEQEEAEHLHDTLQLIKTFQGQGADLVLRGLNISAPVIQVLKDLPAWKGELKFSDCDWHGEDYLYVQLPRHIPGSFKVWALGYGIGNGQLRCVCMAAPTDRTKEHPLSIRLHNEAEVSPESAQDMLRTHGMHPYVDVWFRDVEVEATARRRHSEELDILHTEQSDGEEA